MFGYIYKTKNKINGRVYIGQKQGRFTRQYLGSGKLLKKAIVKYGKENFRVKQIASAETREELNILEIFYIKKYRKTSKVYNLAIGGQAGNMGYDSSGKNNGFYGKHHTPETIKGISQKLRGRTLNQEWRDKISAAKKGRTGWHNGLLGIKRKPRSKEVKLKISNSLKRYFKSKVCL